MSQKESRRIYIKLEDIDNIMDTFTTLCRGINLLLEYYYEKNYKDFEDFLFALASYIGQIMIAFGIKPEDYEDEEEIK